MELLRAYKENPCRTLSIPHWKQKYIKIPETMRILHDADYRNKKHDGYIDTPYFRLYHSLDRVEKITVENISIVSALEKDVPILVDTINQSYTDISVTEEQLVEYTKTEVYNRDLWIMVVDETTSQVVGSGIADFDVELREGIIEWIQVIPSYRRKGIGGLIVNELLSRMVGTADFATVSGQVDNITSPERLYRKCGFVGDDIWHILTKVQ